MTTRGIRNRNPGNIRYVEGVTSTYVGCTGKDDAGFCIFDTADHGIAALCHLLLVYQDKHGLNTIRAIINRWAPPTENQTSAYVTAVANQTGIGPDLAIDLHSPSVMAAVATAIIQHENGEQPYEAAMILTAVGQAPTPPSQEQGGTMAAPNWIDAIGPIAGALNPIAGLVVTAFSPLLKEKLAKALSKHTDSPDTAAQVSENIIEAAKKATGIDDPVQAAATIASKADPAQVAAVEQQTSDLLDKIAPLLDKLGELDKARWAAELAGRDAAAQRSTVDRWDMTPTVVAFAGWTVTALGLGFGFALIYQAVVVHSIDTGLIGVAGPLLAILFGVWKDVFAYRFDGSKVSEAQTAVMQTLATK
jgi:hypothetical protein